ncbi:hypothetical protein M2404_000267 [Rheinheimera pacifica]|nr:hypothetical protein [Rheinheimera pacifica]MCS4305954.1 hypothetical protein [Rheinheimera pacifica]
MLIPFALVNMPDNKASGFLIQADCLFANLLATEQYDLNKVTTGVITPVD